MSDKSLFSEIYDQEVKIRAMLDEAFSLLPDTFYQSPPLGHEPTPEEIQSCDRATARVRELAANIYTALTGEYLT